METRFFFVGQDKIALSLSLDKFMIWKILIAVLGFSSRASAKPSPADEQQQISADLAGRLHPDPLFDYTGLTLDEASCRTQRLDI